MYYGEAKFKELLERLETLTERKMTCGYGEEGDKIDESIKDTKNKLLELFMLRYDK